MKTDIEIKEEVKERYAGIVQTPRHSCGCGNKSTLEVNYSQIEGYNPDADYGLGCGTPTAFANIKEGMTVLDLGSGAGIDCFIAAKYVGASGKVIGVDMTEEMIKKANENKNKLNIPNVDFRLGEIESLPVDSGTVDRVISNCVINLVPHKEKAFSEIHRVLKPGGKFTVSDIVTDGKISEEERRDASLWAGCVSGALEKKDYLAIIEKAGFKEISVTSEVKGEHQLSGGAGLYSITVTGTK
ncbi:MAG TPA: arsenite methyltransferase [Candidatus Acidoferrales bacterium]|nr:arsenite methyltransferase [Candidatus Acidoferrales bacterium]